MVIQVRYTIHIVNSSLHKEILNLDIALGQPFELLKTKTGLVCFYYYSMEYDLKRIYAKVSLGLKFPENPFQSLFYLWI